MTPEQLSIAAGARIDRARDNLPWLEAAMEFYNITTPARQAAFLAQIGHESLGLKHMRELWGPTPAQERYEGRKDLGNVQIGDGYRYRGRGWIQLTGRANYRNSTARLRDQIEGCPDFEANPDMVATPRWAAVTACEFWSRHGLNALADAERITQITRVINGGENGLADRLARWRVGRTALGA